MKGDQLLRALKARADEVEKALAALLPPAGAIPGRVHEAMRYSALGGGKRLRGVLVLEAASLAGRKAPDMAGSAEEAGRGIEVSAATMASLGAARAVAAAVEMVHAYSLIHDDLPCMDDDDFRRGRPANHKVFGEGMALLAGDALLTRAFEVLSRLPWAGISEATANRVIAELAVAGGTAGLIGGQVVDVEAEGVAQGEDGAAFPYGLDPKETLAYIHRHKTGALFRASLVAGGLVGGLDPEGLERLARFADHFGLAFQIVDDILDVTGDAAVLGKQTGSDERRGKLTFPSVYGLDEAKAMASERIQAAKAELDAFGPQGAFLAGLADYILSRDR